MIPHTPNKKHASDMPSEDHAGERPARQVAHSKAATEARMHAAGIRGESGPPAGISSATVLSAAWDSLGSEISSASHARIKYSPPAQNSILDQHSGEEVGGDCEDEAIVVAELECGVSVERGKFVILSNSLRDREAALRQLEHTPDPTIDPCGWRNRLAVNATLERGGCKNHPSYQPVVGYGSVLCAPALTTKAASDNGEERMA